jgi:RNA polymerase sigma-70 factor (ECF subfamily)
MAPDPPFDELIRRVRAGDQQAAADLVRLYEPAIRRAVRFRLVDNRLGAVLDSMDICQSVMASFFVRAAAGQFDLEQPEHLLRLLITMARNKLASQARRERAERRDYRRVSAVDQEARDIPAAASNPDRQVAARDLLQEVYRRLSPDERELVERRNQGREWAAIAAELGGNPTALRKKLSRALDRVTRELGLDEQDP